MISLKEAFGVFTPDRPNRRLTNLQRDRRETDRQRSQRAIYREWERERNNAAAFGPHHVQEIDAIFSRAISEQ